MYMFKVVFIKSSLKTLKKYDFKFENNKIKY